MFDMIRPDWQHPASKGEAMPEQIEITGTGESRKKRRILVSDPLGQEGLDLLEKHAAVEVKTGLEEDELVA